MNELEQYQKGFMILLKYAMRKCDCHICESHAESEADFEKDWDWLVSSENEWADCISGIGGNVIHDLIEIGLLDQDFNLGNFEIDPNNPYKNLGINESKE